MPWISMKKRGNIRPRLQLAVAEEAAGSTKRMGNAEDRTRICPKKQAHIVMLYLQE
jgi:hypothetical protein